MDARLIYPIKDVEEIEQAVFDVAITMIYKLSDATFRPMFRKILGWSNQVGSDEDIKKANMYRQTTLYSFLGGFFGNLKVSSLTQLLPTLFFFCFFIEETYSVDIY